MITQRTNLDAIMQSTCRTHFSPRDMEYLKSYKGSVVGTSRDFDLHRSIKGALKEACDEGLLILTCPTLDVDFVFIKINAGKGIFGGQKSRVTAYVGTVELDELTPGSTFNNLAVALSSINNIHRMVERNPDRAFG